MGAHALGATAAARVLLLALLSRPASALHIIKQLSACSVDTDAGRVDLGPLGNADGTARFTQMKSLLDPVAISYDWNPCYDFSEAAGKVTGTCQSVSLCTVVEGNPTFDFGQQSEASFVANGTQLLLRYTSAAFQTTATVTLVCSPGPDTAIVTNDDTDTHLMIQLNSSTACFMSVGLSTGSVLCIIFFSVSAFYLLGGLIYMKVRHGTSGSELIPNRRFWKEIPALVKEGFLCTTGTIGLTKRRGYESA